MSNSAQLSTAIDRRVRRLETLFSVLLVERSSGFDQEMYHMLRSAYRQRQGFDRESDIFFEEVLRILSRSRPTSDRDSVSSQSQIRQTQEQVLSLEKNFDEIRNDLVKTKLSINELSEEAHQWLTLSSMGVDQSQVKIARFLPLKVYISEGNRKPLMTSALH